MPTSSASPLRTDGRSCNITYVKTDVSTETSVFTMETLLEQEILDSREEAEHEGALRQLTLTDKAEDRAEQDGEDCNGDSAAEDPRHKAEDLIHRLNDRKLDQLVYDEDGDGQEDKGDNEEQYKAQNEGDDLGDTIGHGAAPPGR